MANETTVSIESLERSLKKRFPQAQIALDRPRKESGVWVLDIALDQHPVIVQWQKGKDFSISSSPDRSYGEGADEVYNLEEAAFARIVSLLLSRKFTSPPAAVSLRGLRKEIGLSQTELATILERQQGEISKIERRKDVLVSTLADYARAIQGKLEIIVRLPNGQLRRIELEDTLDASPRIKAPAIR